MSETMESDHLIEWVCSSLDYVFDVENLTSRIHSKYCPVYNVNCSNCKKYLVEVVLNLKREILLIPEFIQDEGVGIDIAKGCIRFFEKKFECKFDENMKNRILGQQ